MAKHEFHDLFETTFLRLKNPMARQPRVYEFFASKEAKH